ncbi:MAG: type I-E CRISPR-associated protein Cas5/CasD [Hyphomonadaceae bacterium]|nr:type I-E CRISPR-associated protein Cas5/CasD [Hyphomonadaceae bacterium]
MAETVAFSLYGAFGAFGGPAGYTRRGTQMEPSRSGLLGICAAALGIPRDDKDRQAALSAWRFACARIEPLRSRQRVIRDYNTAQTVHRKVRTPRTRRDAILRGRVNDAIHTEITQRDYLTDCAFAIAAWGGDTEGLAAALKRPVFAPFLGRKSCPLSAPMDPKVIETDMPWAAFAHLRCPPWFGEGRIERITCDPLGPALAGSRIISTSHAYDEPGARSTWSFHRRAVETRKLDSAIILPLATVDEAPA